MCQQQLYGLVVVFSLFHMKITASVTKGSHQEPGPSYLHAPNFSLYIQSPFLLESKKLSWLLFSTVKQEYYSLRIAF